MSSSGWQTSTSSSVPIITSASSCSSNTLILPLIDDLFSFRWVQALGYFAFLLYLFLGIAIIADIFMCAIEKITSKVKVVTIRTGPKEEDVEEVEVKVWNDTVANLTLMALGSSAPEILLSIIEIVGNGFKSGELGPGTIVGSAAFNLLIITAICIVSLPPGESKRINAIKVFVVTSFFGIFAYMWLFLILVIVSPEVVELWEAILTFLFFPILVFLAYVADRNFFQDSTKVHKDSIVEMGTIAVDGPLGITKPPISKDYFPKGKITKKSLAKFVRDLRKVDPNLTDEDAACLAATYIFESESHSRLFYRVSACRQMAGQRAPLPHLSDHLQEVYNLWKHKGKKGKRPEGGDEIDGTIDGTRRISNGHPAPTSVLKTVAAEEADDKGIAVVQFSSSHAVVLENAGKVDITLNRFGRMDNAFSCVVQTLDRTAVGGVDYKPIRETVQFGPGENEKALSVEIVDDKNWNPDKVFLIRLTLEGVDEERDDVAKGRVCLMTVTIVDDDEPGIVSFSRRLVAVGEGVGSAVIPVIREHGSDGEIIVKYKTVDGTAKSGRDYEGGEGEVTFVHGETTKEITIPISNDLEEERDEYFEVVLTSATGGAKLGKIRRAMVTVTNDDDYNTAIGRLLKKVKMNRDGLRLHRDAWIEQFWSALKVDLPEQEEEADGRSTPSSTSESTVPTGTLLDYLLHVLSFFWKILFAALPPVGIWGGWLTFFSSLIVIGILTAIVGDVASTFGCLVGLEKSVNAITFVALGTSLPDLFASRTAARMERFADNAIGNVTGSNSVNVFLGLGLPWLIAAAYWTVKGENFKVSAGSLGFSVGLYTAMSLIATGVLLARRMLPSLGRGELGGPPSFAWLTCLLFVFLWFVYIALSALQSYNLIGL